MNWWQFLLFPFAIIYDIITRCRNWLYDIGVFKSHSFDGVFTLSVGNLSVGGTGKTPMVEYFIRFGLEQGWEIAILSRGYGRKTKGVLVGSSESDASELGDESFGYLDQFGGKIRVVVAESRVEGMKEIRRSFPEINVVILDDAFQHRSLKADYSVLLTTYDRPFWKDYLMPSGRLREARIGYKRADCLLQTKCNPGRKIEFPNRIATDILGATHIAYGEPVVNMEERIVQVVAVSGIANNAVFFDHLKENFEVVKSFGFNDHYAYNNNDIAGFIKVAKESGAALLCTYKDHVKLRSFKELDQIQWGFVPIQTSFLLGEAELKETLKTQFSLHTNTGMES